MSEEYTQFERLHRRVMQEVAKQRIKAQHLPATPHHARLLGEFVRARMETLHLTPHDFAKLLSTRTEVIDMLMNGQLPEWMLSDDALHRVARALEVETNVLRVMLKRAISKSEAMTD